MFISSNFPVDLSKVNLFSKVSEAREQIVDGNTAMREFRKGKIEDNDPKMVR